MAGWKSSVDGADPQRPPQPAPPQQRAELVASSQQPGGLLGLMQDYLRDNPNY